MEAVSTPESDLEQSGMVIFDEAPQIDIQGAMCVAKLNRKFHYCLSLPAFMNETQRFAYQLMAEPYSRQRRQKLSFVRAFSATR